MIIKNCSRIWHYLKQKLCPASQNQVEPIPVDFINVNQVPAQNIPQVDNTATATTSELLSIATLTLSTAAYFIDLALISINTNVTDKNSAIIVVMLGLTTTTITHFFWIVISLKLRKFTKEMFIQIKNKYFC